MNQPIAVLRVLLVALPALPVVAQAPEAKHLLRHTFQPGKSQFYRQTMAAQNKTSMGEQVMELSMTMETVLELKVVAVKDGKAEVQETVRRIVLKAKGPFDIDFDSDVEGSDAGPLTDMANQVGTTTTFSMDERGRVSDIKLPQGSKPRGGMFGRSPGEQVAQDMPEFPDAPVTIGGTWLETVPMPGMINQQEGTVTHKLVAVEKGKAKVEQRTVSDLDKQVVPGGKMELVKCGGSMVVNLATGGLLERSMEMVLKMNMAGGAGKVDMEATHTMTLVAIEPPLPKKVEQKGVEHVGGESGKK